MSQKVCCVPGCPTVAGDGISLHRFPNPNENIDLFKVWLQKIGGHVAELEQDYVYSNRRVCRRHFEDIYLYPTKLCSLAIPSLCLAENVATDEAMIISEPHTSTSCITNSNEMEMAQAKYSVAYVTGPNKEWGVTLARGLVKNKLAACVNLIPEVTSIYEWKDEINEDSEVLLMIKTRTSHVDKLTEYVRSNHPYEVCEVISLPIKNGNPPYLKWIGDTVPEKN